MFRLLSRLKSFNRNTYGPSPVDVANKRLTVQLKPFECNTYTKHGGGIPIMVNQLAQTPAFFRLHRPGYLLMSSFASRRFSNGWRNGFVVSGAPLIACAISLAAVGKSPVFDEIRARARWLIQ